jgi:hypothetical protein
MTTPLKAGNGRCDFPNSRVALSHYWANNRIVLGMPIFQIDKRISAEGEVSWHRETLKWSIGGVFGRRRRSDPEIKSYKDKSPMYQQRIEDERSGI